MAKNIFLSLLVALILISCQSVNTLDNFGAKIEVLARSADNSSTDYTTLNADSLQVDYKIVSGDGTAKSPYCLAMTVNNKTAQAWKGVLRFQISTLDTTARFFLPGFMYGRNRGDVDMPKGAHKFPRLRSGGKNIPYSDCWLVRSDRLTHPVAMMHVGGNILGISATPYFLSNNGQLEQTKPVSVNAPVATYGGFGCSLEGGKSSVIYTIGYENAPLLYIEAAKQEPQAALGDNCVTIESGKDIKFNMYLYAFASQTPEAINDVIKHQYATFHQSPRKGATYEQTVCDITKAIYEDAWVESTKNYATQVFLKDGKVEHNPLSSIGWTGGVEIATPQLLAALRFNDESMRKQAIECIDNIVKNSMNTKSGLPYDAFNNGKWTIWGWWTGQLPVKGHSSYLAGHCTYYILKAYHYEKRFKNIEHKDWLDFVSGILKVYVSSVDEKGEFPYVFSEENGKGIDYDSFGGAWCLASLAYYNALTGDNQYLDVCKKSEQHYYDAYLSKMECYGTPHDTYKAVDSEGILSYIKATKLLHQITGDSLYVNRLGKALDYEFTFKFPYNVVQDVEPLKKLAWTSSGGSITSVCNPHIHPMSSNVADEILYYYKATNDPYYKSRLDDVMLWGMQCHNRFDGELDYGKKGWMTERYCYSQGLQSERYANGDKASIWFCFLPWGAANIIEGMCGDMWDSGMYRQ